MIRALMEHCVECGGPDPEPDLICARCRPQYPLTISPPAQARDAPSARLRRKGMSEDFGDD
jgi:hypothetical protein